MCFSCDQKSWLTAEGLICLKESSAAGKEPQSHLQYCCSVFSLCEWCLQNCGVAGGLSQWAAAPAERDVKNGPTQDTVLRVFEGLV